MLDHFLLTVQVASLLILGPAIRLAIIKCAEAAR